MVKYIKLLSQAALGFNSGYIINELCNMGNTFNVLEFNFLYL